MPRLPYWLPTRSYLDVGSRLLWDFSRLLRISAHMAPPIVDGAHEIYEFIQSAIDCDPAAGYYEVATLYSSGLWTSTFVCLQAFFSALSHF